MNVKKGRTSRHYKTVWWEKNSVKIIDQNALPHRFSIVSSKSLNESCAHIKKMTVRGAGAIGAMAGYAMAQGAKEAPKKRFYESLSRAAEKIMKTRPTAHDLFYSVERVYERALLEKNERMSQKAALEEAEKLAKQNALAGKKIGEKGEKIVKNNSRVLTHCNAGWLAFVDWGSALAPVYAAKRKAKNPFVYVDETRPRLQGAKLTAWELLNENIRHAIIADNTSGYLMLEGKIDIALVGADRIAANGDVANKIGTYEKAVLAKENSVPFYACAPQSTFDIKTKTGNHISIEERDQKEVLEIGGKRIAPLKSPAFNPAFDVTPAKYITGIITPKGIIKPKRAQIRRIVKK